MANFCPNCGNKLSEGAKFCDSCGFKLAVQPPQPQQTQPRQVQPARPVQAQQTVRQPVQPNAAQSGTAQPPKKRKGWLIALIIAGSATLLVIIAIVLAVILGARSLRSDYPMHPPVGMVTEAPTEAPAPTEVSAPTEAPAPTQAPVPATQAPVPATQAPAKLPYADSLSAPSPTDFTWIADAMSGNLEGTYLGKNDFIGKWKGEMIFDGVWELVTVTIDTDGSVTMEPYQINYGDGWESEAGESPYRFSGTFDVGGAGNIAASGAYGDLNLYTFVESYGVQYGVGAFTSSASGVSAQVYLVRP